MPILRQTPTYDGSQLETTGLGVAAGLGVGRGVGFGVGRGVGFAVGCAVGAGVAITKTGSAGIWVASIIVVSGDGVEVADNAMSGAPEGVSAAPCPQAAAPRERTTPITRTARRPREISAQMVRVLM